MTHLRLLHEMRVESLREEVALDMSEVEEGSEGLAILITWGDFDFVVMVTHGDDGAFLDVELHGFREEVLQGTFTVTLT